MRHARNANERDFARMARELRNLLQPALGDSLMGVGYLPVLPNFSIHLWQGANVGEKALARKIGESFADENGARVFLSVLRPSKHWFVASRARAQAGESIEDAADRVAGIVAHSGDFDATRVRSIVASVQNAYLGHGKSLDPVVVERRARDILTSRHGLPLEEFELSLKKLGRNGYMDFHDWLGLPVVQFEGDAPGFVVCFGDLFTIPEHHFESEDGEQELEFAEHLGSRVCLKVIPHPHDGKVLYVTLAETWPGAEVVDGRYVTVSFRSLEDLKKKIEEFASDYEDLPIPPNGEPGWPFSPKTRNGRRRNANSDFSLFEDRDYYWIDRRDPGTDVRVVPCPDCKALVSDDCVTQARMPKARPHLVRVSNALRVIQARQEAEAVARMEAEAVARRAADLKRIAEERERVRGRPEDNERISQLEYDEMILRGLFDRKYGGPRPREDRAEDE